MSISFDKALGIHVQTLQVRGRRTELLAENLANSDTPRYKAKDLDFREVMRQIQGGNSPHRMVASHAGHISPDLGPIPEHLEQYRSPLQPSMDGNTVDSHIEKAEFARNALQMQATLRFLNGKFSGMKKALKGE